MRGGARNLRTGGFLGKEMKFIMSETTADAFSTVWATMENATKLCLNGAAQGVGEQARIGRKQFIHSVHVKGFIKTTVAQSKSEPIDAELYRVVLVLDTQTNAAQMTASDVFDISQNNDVLSYRNLQQTHRFKVLWDKTFQITPNNTNEGAVGKFAAGVHIRTFKINKVFKTPLVVMYKDASATVASITDNSLHIIGIAEAIANVPLLQWQSRCRFTG